MSNVISDLFGIEEPKPKMKSREQLEAEQEARIDRFEAKSKTDKRNPALKASLIQEDLTGGLSPLGATTKLGTSKKSVDFLKNQTKGS